MKQKKLKEIYYFGENRDISDKWLIKILKDHFRVTIIKPDANKIINNSDYIINRLYVSIYKRYSKKKINELLIKINELEKIKDINTINSVAGFFLEYDRIKQYKFFNFNKIPFVSTKSLINIKNNKSLKFPIILKNNHSGRNRKLEIIDNFFDLDKIPSSIKKEKVAQEFINNKVCYRTEFIGNNLLTFPQEIYIKNNELKFRQIPVIIKIGRAHV